MDTRGTLADLIEWAKSTLPGEETRAQTVITTCRKADLFTKGGRGRHAPFTKLTDFPTAILAVLHNGAATKSDEIVQRLWTLPLVLIKIDDPERIGPVEQEPENWDDENAGPYLKKFNLRLALHGSNSRGDNLIGVLTSLFSDLAPHKDFHRADRINLETCGDRLAVEIVLNGGNRVTNEGWSGEGPDHSQVTLTFGDLAVSQARAIKTTRTIWADSLNELSMMAPNLTKVSD
tara:strand:- start:1412 stop:2110 length:699 start_codon:yes stop_codon:yes gene_type:complete